MNTSTGNYRMKKILIIEDDINHIEKYEAELGGKVELILAETVVDAKRLFDENTDVAAVVVDGCLTDGGEPDTLEVVRHIRRTGFSGPMIANSSTHNKLLREAGCDKSCTYGDKGIIPTQLIELLGL